MTITFINRFFYPDHSATSQMLLDLAFALAERGHAVCVITSRLTYEGGGPHLARRETVRGVEVIRIATTAFGRANLAGRTLDYLTFYLSAGWTLLWHLRRGGILVAKTDPPMLSVLAALVCRLKGARQINWLQDIFPEVASELGMGRSRTLKWAFWLLRKLRDASLRTASANVVIGERMAGRVRQSGVPPERIRIIPNWANSKLISPVEPQRNALRREWELEDAFVVGYSGNLGRAHDIETCLAAIAALVRHQAAAGREPAFAGAGAGPANSPARKIRWLFTGGGAGMDRLKREIAERALPHVIFKPYQPAERLAESLSLPDVHVISLKPALEGLIVPSKYYSIAAAGRPAIFIGDPDGEIARILERTGTGFTVREGDGEGLARLILTLAADPELAAAKGCRARQLFESGLDFPFAAAAWEKLIGEASLDRP